MESSGEASGLRRARCVLGGSGQHRDAAGRLGGDRPSAPAAGHLPVARGERGLASSIAGSRAAGQPALTAWGCHFLGPVQRAQGRLNAALGTYQQTLEITAPTGQSALPVAGMAHVGMAEVAYQRDDLEAALQHVSEGIALCRQLFYPLPLAAGLATLAWIRQAQGDPAGALEAIGDAARAGPGPAVAGLLNPVPAQRARLLLAQGDLATAARWAEERGLGPDDKPDYPREREYLVLARVLLAQDRPAQAVALLERLHAAAVAQNRTGSVIEIQALRALALAASGEEAGAVDVLAGALTLACPQGYVRVFADEGPPMGALLGRLIAAQRTDHAAARGVPLGFLAEVLRASGGKDARQGPRPDVTAAVPGLVEQLTARELEILALLAAGMPNPRIAQELVVSLDTVKKHVSHLLASSARPIAPRPSPGPASSASLPSAVPAARPPSSGLKPADVEVLEYLPDPFVKRALRQLPEAFRTAVYLADVEGYSYREIAGIMGIPEGPSSTAAQGWSDLVRLPAAAELATIGAGYVAYALVRLAIRASSPAATPYNGDSPWEIR